MCGIYAEQDLRCSSPFKGESKRSGEGATGRGMGFAMRESNPIPTSLLPLSPKGISCGAKGRMRKVLRI